MRTEVEGGPRVAAVAIGGRLEANPEPETKAATAADSGRYLVADLAATDYICSVGLRVWMALTRRTRTSTRQLRRCGLHGAVHEVLALARSVPVLGLRDSCERAVKELAAA